MTLVCVVKPSCKFKEAHKCKLLHVALFEPRAILKCPEFVPAGAATSLRAMMFFGDVYHCVDAI
eukprot:6206581-Pleurochrysis_carterae.AAC.3